MAIMCGVLERNFGKNQEGEVIQCDGELLAKLIESGIAREATDDDMIQADAVAEDKDEQPLENLEPQENAKVARQLANHAEETVTKAVDKVAEQIMSDSRKAFHAPSNRHIAGSDYHKTGGFKNLGEAAHCWFRGARGDWEAGKKYAKYGKAMDAHFKATGMSIGGGSGHQGGDLVPEQWAEDLWKLSFKDVPDLMGMMTKYEMRNQIENIPSWVQASATSAITATVISEASDITATVGATATVQLALQKFAALVNVSDELLRFNSYNLQNVLEQVVPQRIRYAVNDGVINGTYSQVNLIGNAAAVSVIRQQASHINYDDVTKMDAALLDEFDNEDAIWLTNRQTLPELMSLSFPNRSGTTPIPAWAAGTFGQENLLGPRPKGFLLGKKVYTVENVPGLGSRGNLILANLKSMAYGSSGLIADRTPYLYFNLAQDTFRFMWYADTVNPMTVPYQYVSDSSYHSNVVVLTAGSTSSS